ncbi:hypothetical protein CEXT_137061 [Caerostris extrusa]|uniref:Uncharacterized protein n=1 Tax=Caerostris extrusa TaxID=172846 RepID=A0AAV4NCI5_CAEEX|nr:hypothetical protein CEXT_137061 [Caerostris extrusa]
MPSPITKKGSRQWNQFHGSGRQRKRGESHLVLFLQRAHQSVKLSRPRFWCHQRILLTADAEQAQCLLQA